MKIFLWDYSKGQGVTDALFYFADYWTEVSFGHTPLASDFENPRTLLNLIQDEIDFNNLQTKEMREFFSKRIKYYLQNDYLLDPTTLAYFKILNDSINSGTTDLIYWNAAECVSTMSSGDYVRYLISTLKKFVLSNEKNIKIKMISDALIIEFIMAGFGLEYIKKIPQKILGTHREISSEIFTTEFPHDIKYADFKMSGGDYNNSQYHNKIKEFIDQLSIADRLDAISKLYFSEEEELVFIFQLKGVRGDIGEIQVGDIHIYSPQNFSYIKKNAFRSPSDSFATVEDLGITPANVAIKFKTRDAESALTQVVAKIQESLSFLQFYLPNHIEITVANPSCHVVDETGNVRFESFQADKNSNFWFWNDKSVEINDLHMTARNNNENFKNFFSMKREHRHSTFSYEQITHALHFFDKATKEKTPEGRLINLWVCLEKIVADRKTLFSLDKSKFSLISDLIPYLVTDRLFDRGWVSFYYMKSLYDTRQGGTRLLSLSNELAAKVHFSSEKGQTLFLKDYIENLDDVHNSTDKTLIKEHLEVIKDFYFDTNKGIKFLENDILKIQKDLLLIYRARNKIVHDAHFDPMAINFLVDRLSHYVTCSMRDVISNYCVNDERIYDFLLKRKVGFLHRLEVLRNQPDQNIFSLLFIRTDK